MPPGERQYKRFETTPNRLAHTGHGRTGRSSASTAPYAQTNKTGGLRSTRLAGEPIFAALAIQGTASASVGANLAALAAGYSPATAPTSTVAPSPPSDAHNGTSVGHD